MTGTTDRDSPPRVVAVVLTYDAPEHVARCIESLGAQTLQPRSAVVVENPGAHRTSHADLTARTRFPVELLALPDNLGPAGGYAEGLRRAAMLECDAIWVMDDDVAPGPDTLAQLGKTWEQHQRHAVVLPESTDAESGEDSSTWGWCGALMPRDLVDAIGTPLVELFYGFEDLDYLIDRAQQAGYPLVRDPHAVVQLARRADQRRPVWHYYYLPRNATYVYLYRRRHIPLLQRVKRLAWFLYRFFRGIFTTQRDRRADRVVMFVRGVLDGASGRLGRRLEPTETGRPSAGGPPDSHRSWGVRTGDDP